MSDADSDTETHDHGRSELDVFRDSWQRELQAQATSTNATDTDMSKAELFYRTAVQLEQKGKVYDALPFYRKATQIVPDIEFKFYEQQKLNNPDASTKLQNLTNDFAKQLDMGKSDVELHDDNVPTDLYEKFQQDLSLDERYGGKLMMNSRDASVLTTGLHISNLPPEILLRIFRWVVSAQLDMRSLEQCAAVCKGFYVYARSEELWRLACVKVWGHNVGSLDEQNIESSSTYYSWREMFIRRERLRFSGCYISKTTYLRMGENSFQDQFYRPIQLVEYYRYIRFMPDGTVLMMTSADEPAKGVGKLKQLHNSRPDVLRGRYCLYGNTVTLVLQKAQPRGQGYMRQRRGSIKPVDEDANSAAQFLIELRITNTPKRPCAQLLWSQYTMVQKRNKVDISSDFDLTDAKYPPLWFSHVRSYHLDADAPLA